MNNQNGSMWHNDWFAGICMVILFSLILIIGGAIAGKSYMKTNAAKTTAQRTQLMVKNAAKGGKSQQPAKKPANKKPVKCHK